MICRSRLLNCPGSAIAVSVTCAWDNNLSLAAGLSTRFFKAAGGTAKLAPRRPRPMIRPRAYDAQIGTTRMTTKRPCRPILCRLALVAVIGVLAPGVFAQQAKDPGGDANKPKPEKAESHADRTTV